MEVAKSRKQRGMARQMHTDLVSLGYVGSYGRVAAFVRAWKAERQRDAQTSGCGTFVPLAFAPGEAFQFDWSEDWAVCFTAPTAYRLMLKAMDQEADLSSLCAAVSAGETLPAQAYEEWIAKTCKPMLDGIVATEMLHIFITNRFEDHARASTGRPITGYVAKIVSADMNDLPIGEIGCLAAKGRTGCRYMADDRHQKYVRDGWNLKGDHFWQDDKGRFHFAARSDDMIISAGYNIAGPEVETAPLTHPAVSECAVVGAPNIDRGIIVEAHVVLVAGHLPV